MKRGWLIDISILPWINIWEIEILKEFITTKKHLRREKNQISFSYIKPAWSFLIPEDILHKKYNRIKLKLGPFNIGRSQICLSRKELIEKMEKIRNLALKSIEDSNNRVNFNLEYLQKEQLELKEILCENILNTKKLNELELEKILEK